MKTTMTHLDTSALSADMNGEVVDPAHADYHQHRRVFNAMIAATALARGLPLFTCNPDDFRGIDDLAVVAVPVPPDPGSS